MPSKTPPPHGEPEEEDEVQGDQVEPEENQHQQQDPTEEDHDHEAVADEHQVIDVRDNWAGGSIITIIGSNNTIRIGSNSKSSAKLQSPTMLNRTKSKVLKSKVMTPSTSKNNTKYHQFKIAQSSDDDEQSKCSKIQVKRKSKQSMLKSKSNTKSNVSRTFLKRRAKSVSLPREIKSKSAGKSKALKNKFQLHLGHRSKSKVSLGTIRTSVNGPSQIQKSVVSWRTLSTDLHGRTHPQGKTVFKTKTTDNRKENGKSNEGIEGGSGLQVPVIKAVDPPNADAKSTNNGSGSSVPPSFEKMILHKPEPEIMAKMDCLGVEANITDQLTPPNPQQSEGIDSAHKSTHGKSNEGNQGGSGPLVPVTKALDPPKSDANSTNGSGSSVPPSFEKMILHKPEPEIMAKMDCLGVEANITAQLTPPNPQQSEGIDSAHKSTDGKSNEGNQGGSGPLVPVTKALDPPKADAKSTNGSSNSTDAAHKSNDDKSNEDNKNGNGTGNGHVVLASEKLLRKQ